MSDTWSPAEYLVPQLSSSTGYMVVPFHHALSIGYSEASLALLAEKDGRLNASWFGSLAFDVPEGLGPVPLQFQGHVRKDADTRGVMVVSIGDDTFVRDFPYGVELDEDVDFSGTFGSASPAKRRLTVTVVLLVERQRKGAEILLQADTIDVAEVGSPPIFSPDVTTTSP